MSKAIHCRVKSPVWIYCRVAHPDLFTLERQEAHLVSYAEQYGLTIVGMTSETGNGLSLHREGLQKVTHALETGKAKNLLVKNFSRICRNREDAVAYLEWLEQHHITLLCADGTDPIPYGTIDRSLMELASKG